MDRVMWKLAKMMPPVQDEDYDGGGIMQISNTDAVAVIG